MCKCAYYADYLVLNGYETPYNAEEIPHYSLFYWGSRLKKYEKIIRTKK